MTQPISSHIVLGQPNVLGNEGTLAVSWDMSRTFPSKAMAEEYNSGDDMFGELINAPDDDEVVDSIPEDESELMRQCEFELDQYLNDKGL
jgi:hypothetical protein